MSYSQHFPLLSNGPRIGDFRCLLTSVVFYLSVKVVLQQFYITNLPLPVVDDCQDLGITVTKHLASSKYISDIVNKAHCTANMIHRCFVSQKASLLVHAFTTYIRPLLEYNSVTRSLSLNSQVRYSTYRTSTV